jgi:hypothetical protein
VPWCETCDRFLSPSTVHADGTCPKCGRSVDPGRAHAADPAAATVAPSAEEPVTNIYGEPVDDEKVPLPWHLKLLAGALAVYLGYRFLQGIEWAFGG